MTRTSTLSTMLALIAFSFGSVCSAAQVGDDINSFPSYPETEYEQSIITIPIYHGEGAERNAPVEILKLTAFMRLEREVPTRNGLGHRQIEFTIADWELYGYSEFLDADITFKLSDVPVQPKSLIISLTEQSDYPAMIVYNAIYDIYIGQKLVAKNQPGVAFAKNVYEIPPRNISVAFSKPFSLPDAVLSATPEGTKGQSVAATDAKNTIACQMDPCPCPFLFCNGTCEDMFQITRPEFEEGLAISRAIREGKYTLRR